MPFVQETYGGLGPQAKRFISELVRQSKEHSPPTVTRFRDYAIRALAVCLVNGNCFVQHAVVSGSVLGMVVFDATVVAFMVVPTALALYILLLLSTPSFQMALLPLLSSCQLILFPSFISCSQP